MRYFQSFIVAAAVLGSIVGCELNKPPVLETLSPDAGAAGAPAEPLDPVVVADGGTQEPVEPTEPLPDPVDGNEGPEIGALAFSAVLQVGEPVVISAPVADPDGVASCRLYANTISGNGLVMDLLDDDGVIATNPLVGTASLTLLPYAAGESKYYVRCYDAAVPAVLGQSAVHTVHVAAEAPPAPDVTAPVITFIYPLANSTVDARDVQLAFRWIERNDVTCEVATDGVWAQVVLDISTLYMAYPTLAAGDHTFAVRCTDDSGNVALTETRTVHVVSNSALGAVRATPSTVVVGANITFSTDVDNRTALASCAFLLDGASQVPLITPGTGGLGGTVSAVAAPAVGSHVAQFSCVDTAGKTHLSGTRTVTVTPDVIAPTVGAVAHTPNDALLTVGASYTFSAAVADEHAIAQCSFAFAGGIAVAAPVSGGIASATVVYNGQASATLSCVDTSNNPVSATVALVAAPIPDTAAPAVSGIGWTPNDAALTVGATYLFAATVSDNVGVNACSVSLSNDLGATVTVTAPATLASGTASASLAYNGETSVWILCNDAAGNVGSTSVPLTAAPPPPPPPAPI